MNHFEKLSDRELYTTCKKCGAEALAARRRFAGLLPEVWRREKMAKAEGRSWLRVRGFTCLYEFAAKLAGMSRDRVDLVVRIERRLEDKPVLREALVEGRVSVNRLARIVSIATPENQGEMLGKVGLLSQRALDVFVKEVRKSDGLCEPQNAQITVCAHTLKLDPDVERELLEMQEKGLDVSGMLREFLRERREKLEKMKRAAAEKQEQEHEIRSLIAYPANRYIPAEVKKIIKEEFGDRCSVPGCGRRAENLHHEKGFAKTQNHDPRCLKPLCKGHHELAHAGCG